MQDFFLSLAWNNPFNLYAPLSGRTTIGESVASFAVWSAIPIGSYGIGYAMVGSEALAGVSYYSLPYLIGGVAATGWSFGAMSAAAMVYDVHTDPVKKAKMEREFSPGADIFRHTGFGGMSL